MREHRGLSILEVIISIGIFALLIGGIAMLQTTIFRSNRLAGTRIEIDQRSLSILRRFTSELRAAQTPHDGSFPVAEATGSSVSFYSDINDDATIERIRYIVENGALKRGVIIPTGQPLTYDPAQESISTLISNLDPTPPYFIYYDANFDGVTSTASLAEPILLSSIRVVELHLGIRTNNETQPIRSLQTRAMLRILKNL